MADRLCFRIERFLAHRARLLQEGRYHDLAASTLLPLPVTLDTYRIVIRDRDELILHMHRKRVALQTHGLTCPEPTVVAVDLLPRGDRRRVWVRWQAHQGQTPHESFSVYEIAERRGAFFLASMTFLQLLMPEFGRPSNYRRLIRPSA